MTDIRGESLVPGVRSLFQAVKRFLQQTHSIRSGEVNEAGWLLIVDGLLQVSVKKSTLHLVDWIGHAREAAMMRMTWIVDGLTTELNVSS